MSASEAVETTTGMARRGRIRADVGQNVDSVGPDRDAGGDSYAR